MSRGYSDSYLQGLWRKAVKAHWGERCVKCKAEPVQCHHIIKRRYAVLRNDWKNGIPLCAKCHNWIETLPGSDWLYWTLGEDHRMYLATRERVNIKDHLVQHGITRKEFDQRTAERLKEKIAEGRDD